MLDSKSIFQSRTLWANLVGIVCFGLSIVGIDTCGIDKNQIIDTILQGITFLSFILSSLWRLKASTKLLF